MSSANYDGGKLRASQPAGSANPAGRRSRQSTQHALANRNTRQLLIPAGNRLCRRPIYFNQLRKRGPHHGNLLHDNFDHRDHIVQIAV